MKRNESLSFHKLVDELERTWKKAEQLQPKYRARDGSANTLGDIY